MDEKNREKFHRFLHEQLDLRFSTEALQLLERAADWLPLYSDVNFSEAHVATTTTLFLALGVNGREIERPRETRELATLLGTTLNEMEARYVKDGPKIDQERSPIENLDWISSGLREALNEAEQIRDRTGREGGGN